MATAKKTPKPAKRVTSAGKTVRAGSANVKADDKLLAAKTPGAHTNEGSAAAATGHGTHPGTHAAWGG